LLYGAGKFKEDSPALQACQTAIRPLISDCIDFLASKHAPPLDTSNGTTNGERKESKSSPAKAAPTRASAINIVATPPPSAPSPLPVGVTAPSSTSSSSHYTPLVVEIEDLTLTAYVRSMTEFSTCARAVLKPLMKEANLERLDMVFRSFVDEPFLLHLMTNAKLTK
jgi:hypothetical protein